MSDTLPVYVDHYLITGQVAFLPAGDNAQPQALALNTLVKVPHGHKLDAKVIGLAQQGLQMMVHRRLGTELPPKMLDVCILNIVALGHFVEGEFEAGSMLADEKSDAIPN